MNFVRSDNPLIAKSLEAMKQLVIERGGFVHPAACIEEQDGSIRTICRDPLAIGQPLFKVPEALLVATDELDWNAREDIMELSNRPVEFSADRQKMLDLFITIYNATDKLVWLRDQASRVILRDAQLAENISQVGYVNPDYNPNPSTAADAFIRTRYYASNHLLGDLAGRNCLMPLIDSINHHFKGSGYRHEAAYLISMTACPQGSEECFSDYGGYRDPFGLALAHGYVDPHSPYARSVPARIEIAGFGQFEIVGKRAVSPHRADLPKVELSGDGLTLSHLSGDARSPHYLHGTLRLVMMASGKQRGIAASVTERALADLPAAILAANQEKHARFRAYLATRPDLPLASLLSRASLCQMAILERILAV